jgi:hypothetical protein
VTGWTRWRAIRPTEVFFEDPTLEPVRIPKGGIVLTESYSQFSQQTWIRVEVLPGYLWLDTVQFEKDFERIG